MQPRRRRSIRLRGWDYASRGAYFVTIVTRDRVCWFDRPRFRAIVEQEWRKLPDRFPTVRLDEFVVMPNHVHFVIWLNPPPLASVGAQFNCAPTDASTGIPTALSTDAPTDVSTDAPTGIPTDPSTDASTGAPTDIPTDVSTDAPTGVPTDIPTDAPTDASTDVPTDVSTDVSTDAPTGDGSPIGRPFTVESERPTLGWVVRTFKAAITRRIRLAGGDGFAWQRNYYERIIRDERELRAIRRYIRANPDRWVEDREFRK